MERRQKDNVDVVMATMDILCIAIITKVQL